VVVEAVEVLTLFTLLVLVVLAVVAQEPKTVVLAVQEQPILEAEVEVVDTTVEMETVAQVAKV
jgi:hypothetical protein